MENVQAVLGAHGALVRALEGFRPRPAQQQMAARVEEALRAREVLLVEAGTGTGKTFAYLVPVLLSGLRVLISTGTRTLQDQLYHRDLPLLAGALGRPARIALLKGRSNYLCRARLAEIGRQQQLLPERADTLRTRIEEWSLATRSGDLAELPELADTHPLRPQISSTRENCAGTRCSEYARCHVFQARRAALDADIVIVNHHLLLADLALKEDGFGDLLPSVDALILDEAHQLPDLASEFFGISLSSRQVELLLADAKLELRAAGLDAPAAAALTVGLERSLAAAYAAVGSVERHSRWGELQRPVQQAITELQQALYDCGAQLQGLAAQAQLQQCAGRARALGTALTQIIDQVGPQGPTEPHELPQALQEPPQGPPTGAAAPSADVPVALAGARTLSADARGFALRLLPYEISNRFQAIVRQARNAWIFTSATLAVGADFSHFADRLGLTQAVTLQLDSPFDFQRQALLYLPPGLPPPSDPAFNDAVVETVRPLLEAAGGGAFVLFTSHRALRHAAQLLGRQLSPELPLLVQGTAPREQLLRRFRSSGNAVLLGSASFWEGVDVQGPALRLVIIDKLPFASPEDPVVRSRIEYLKLQGVSPFQQYQLPEAVLALKQGVGRLIRSEQDRGVVVLCDPRVRERSYGRTFRNSLPPMRVTLEREVALQTLHMLARQARGEPEPAVAAAACPLVSS